MKKNSSLVLLSLSAFTFAHDGALIESVEYSGNGCLENEALAVVSPDQQILSLLFDKYVVEAGGENNPRRGYKECMVKMNLSVPQDTRVVIEKIDYRGYAMLPEVGRMNFSSSYYIEIPELDFTSKVFTKKERRIGEVDEDFFFDQNIKNKLFKSKCGHDFTLNFESELMAMTNRHNDEVYVSLDSIDTGIDFHISYEKCEQRFRRAPRELERRQRRRLEANRSNRSNQHLRSQRRVRRVREGNAVRDRRCSSKSCVNNSRINQSRRNIVRPDQPNRRVNTRSRTRNTSSTRRRRP